MVVLRVRFKYVYQLQFEFLDGFSVFYCFNMSWPSLEEDRFINLNDKCFNQNCEDNDLYK